MEPAHRILERFEQELVDRICFGMLTVKERKELLRLLDKCSAKVEPEALAR